MPPPPHTHTHTTQEGPDHQTGYNLVLCAAALGDADLMRSAFTQLLQVGRGTRNRAGAQAW